MTVNEMRALAIQLTTGDDSYEQDRINGYALADAVLEMFPSDLEEGGLRIKPDGTSEPYYLEKIEREK